MELDGGAGAEKRLQKFNEVAGGVAHKINAHVAVAREATTRAVETLE